MKDNRLKIGEFSRLCRVTVRTLRHYEAIELLTPQIVEDWTGYRYYAIEHGGYKPNDVDIEYCEQVKSMGKNSEMIKFKEIPAVPTAICMKVFGTYDKLCQNYIDLFSWIEKEGYRITGDPRANYIDGIWNQEDSDKWLTVIQVPVEKV